MTHYQCRVQLHADASTNYDALTTPEGLRGWWTTDCDVNPQAGGVHSFRFEGILFNSMQVAESVPGERVHWKCVDGWNEWKGTEVVFTIRDGECSQGWDTFIQSSRSFPAGIDGTRRALSAV